MSGRRVAVMGFGATGQAVARYLVGAGDQPVVFDDLPPQEAAATQLGVEVELTPAPDVLRQRLEGCAMVVPSPGVPVSHPVFTAAKHAGVAVVAEIELAAAALSGPDAPRLAAVTGTNGKTTVTTLATAILKASGIEAVPAGNIGVPLIEAAFSGADVVVAEVSSFQLQFTDTFHPEVSCWLNLSPDHLDWHPSIEHYAAAKQRIWANQGPGDVAVVNADDPAVASAAAASLPAGVACREFSVHRPADFFVREGRLWWGATEIIEVAELARSFPHDLSNSLAAAAVAVSLGGTVEGCRSALRQTAPLPHRVSLVGSAGGVSWYDDSKATTPASVLAAVAGFDSVVLIAGGRNKGLDLSVLSSAAPPVHAVVAIGESAGEVAGAFEGRAKVAIAGSMEAAVEAAAEFARPGDAVLLSPGCASFDWYPSYSARGDDFARIVSARLSGKEASC